MKTFVRFSVLFKIHKNETSEYKRETFIYKKKVHVNMIYEKWSRSEGKWKG